jgi:hypothetical protein
MSVPTAAATPGLASGRCSLSRMDAGQRAQRWALDGPNLAWAAMA